MSAEDDFLDEVFGAGQEAKPVNDVAQMAMIKRIESQMKQDGIIREDETLTEPPKKKGRGRPPKKKEMTIIDPETGLPAPDDIKGMDISWGGLAEAHPFQAFQKMIHTLEKSVKQAEKFTTAEDPDWARVKISAVGKLMAISDKLLPIWEEMQNQFKVKRMAWTDSMIDFCVFYISNTYGATEVTKFMAEWTEFKDNIDETLFQVGDTISVPEIN